MRRPWQQRLLLRAYVPGSLGDLAMLACFVLACVSPEMMLDHYEAIERERHRDNE